MCCNEKAPAVGTIWPSGRVLQTCAFTYWFNVVNVGLLYARDSVGRMAYRSAEVFTLESLHQHLAYYDGEPFSGFGNTHASYKSSLLRIALRYLRQVIHIYFGMGRCWDHFTV